MKLPNNLGMMLLAIWLIADGAMAFGLSFTNSHIIMGLLALVAGILLLLGR